MGQWLRIGISVGLSAFFLYFAVKDVEWAQAGRAIESANYLYVLPILMTSVWTLIVRAQRWRVFLRPLGVPPLRPLIAATNIGFMANMVLPGRVGEVIRPVLVSRRENLPLGGILATVLLERVFDLLMVVVILGVAMLAVPIDESIRSKGYFATALAVAMMAVIAVLRWQEARALAVVRAVAARLPETIGKHLYDLVVGFVKALEILNSPLEFLRASLWTVYVWLVIAVVNALGLAAFHLPIEATWLVTGIIAIAVAVPSAPGYVGTFQWGAVAALSMYHVPDGDALAFSLIHHLLQFFATVGAGVYSLWTENMSFREIEQVKKDDDQTA